MLKAISIFLDVLSAVLGMLAPLCIVHWILGAFDIPAIAPVVSTLAFIFKPFNTLVDFVIPFNLPDIQYQDKNIPVIQGVLGFILTGMFMLFALAANIVRALEKKMEIQRQLIRTRQKAHQMEITRQEKEKKTQSASTIMVYILFRSDNEQDATPFFQGFKRYGGKQSSTKLAEGWLLEFDEPKLAMQYVTECAEAMLAQYSKLRPMDPKPPFQLVMHAVGSDFRSIEQGAAKCEWMRRYVGENQIIFSQQVHDVMRLKRLVDDYNFQTLGYYDIAGEQSQEVFLLYYKSPEQKIYY